MGQSRSQSSEPGPKNGRTPQELPEEQPLSVQVLTAGQTTSAHVVLASALLRAGRHTEAAAELDDALRVNPEYAVAHYLKALTLIAQSDYPGAAVHLEYAVRLGGGDDHEFDYWTTLATVQRERGLLDLALAALDRALVLQPNHAKSHLERGEILTLLDRREEAQHAYEEALRHNPLLSEARYRLARFHLANGRVEEATEQTLRALRLNPSSVQARFSLGNLLRRLGRHQEALKEYGMAMEVAARSQLGQIWTSLGETFLEMGNTTEALISFQKAVQLDPRQFSAFLHLGRLHLDSGCASEAVELLQAALGLDPSYPEAIALLEKAKGRVGSHD
jgi:superkiller protein 3